MNKKFLAILVLLSVIPGCWWGPRYHCNTPCGEQRTTCVEATDCYQEAPAAEGEEYCYEAQDGEYCEAEPNAVCYEAEDYPTFEEEAPEEEFGYDEFDE